MQKKYAIWAVAVLVIAAAWLIGGKLGRQQTEQPAQDDNQQTQVKNDDLETVGGKVWFGELEKSDDAKRGNLMLVWDEAKPPVYINTSRDFNQLIGREVEVTYEGNTQQFRLLDIKAK